MSRSWRVPTGGPGAAGRRAQALGGPRERPLDARLVPAAALAWGGAAWAVGAPAAAAGGVALAAVVGGALLVALGRAGSVALALVLVAAVCASVLSTDLLRGRGLLEPLAQQGATAVLEGSAAGDARRVRADPGRPWASSTPRWAVRVSAERVTGRGSTSSAHGEVLVIGGAGWGAVRRGDVVTTTGRLVVTGPADRAAALVLALGPPVVEPPAGRWARWAQHLRAGLVRACSPLPDDARGLLPGLVVGDSTALAPDLEEAMRTTGLTHLTAVSGGNTALVTGAVLAVAAAAGAGRRLRLVLAGGALLGFAALAGAEPSVLRAAVMGAAVLVGAGASRGAGGLPALSAAVAVLLVADPWLGRGAGFALSVLATGALLVLAPAWTAALAGALARAGARGRGRAVGGPGPLARVVAAALVVPLAAQLVCGPVVLLLSPGVALLAVPANLVAAPAVAPATLLGLAATLLEPLAPPAAGAAARLGGLGAQWVALVARTGAAAPVTTAPWPQGPLPALALAAVTLLVAAAAGTALRRRG